MPTGVYVRDPEIEAARRAKISIAISASMTPEKRQRIGDTLRGSNAPWYKEEQLNTAGYILVHCSGHPRADGHGRIKRAILIAEQKLGRYTYA